MSPARRRDLVTAEVMRIDPLAPGIAGTALWAVLLAAALATRSDQVWTCVAGLGVGAALLVWGLRARRRQRSPASPGASSDGSTTT